MKKLLFGLLAFFGLILLLLVGLLLIGAADTSEIRNFTSNEKLPTVRENWKGTPVDQKGRFVNAEFPFLPSPVDLLKWTVASNPQKTEKENDEFRLNIQDPGEFLGGEKEGMIWLGHASLLVRLGGKTILIDPVFGEPPFIERYFNLPSPLEKIRRVDYVLTTHDHRDHLDEATIKAIAGRFPQSKFLAGIGSEDILREWTGAEDRVLTAGWFQQFALDEANLKIVFVPVRHWSRRGLFDTNRRLWGGYIVSGAGTSLYHGGDSGYGSHYAELAESFPEIDYFVIGIGSYEPRWIMKPNHNNPEEAVQAFVDSKAKMLVPMHYATFNMTDEPPGEPLRRLKDEVRKVGLNEKLKPLDIYESLMFESSD